MMPEMFLWIQTLSIEHFYLAKIFWSKADLSVFPQSLPGYLVLDSFSWAVNKMAME